MNTYPAIARFEAQCEVCRMTVRAGAPISPQPKRFTHLGCSHGAGHGHGIREGCPNPHKRGFHTRMAAYQYVTPGGSAYKCVCGSWHRTSGPSRTAPVPTPPAGATR